MIESFEASKKYEQTVDKISQIEPIFAYSFVFSSAKYIVPFICPKLWCIGYKNMTDKIKAEKADKAIKVVFRDNQPKSKNEDDPSQIEPSSLEYW